MKKKEITINNQIEHKGIFVHAVTVANSFFAFTKKDTTFQPQDENKRLSATITDASFPVYNFEKKYTRHNFSTIKIINILEVVYKFNSFGNNYRLHT